MHYQSEWVSCIHNECIIHMGEKIKHNAFPIQVNNSPLTQYEKGQTQRLVVRSRIGTRVILGLDPSIPFDCWQEEAEWNITAWEVCDSPTCKIHLHDKVYQYHKAVGAAPKPCGGPDNLCIYWNCPTHLPQKNVSASEINKAKQKRHQRRWYPKETPCIDGKLYTANCSGNCIRHAMEKERFQKIIPEAYELGMLKKGPLPQNYLTEEIYALREAKEYAPNKESDNTSSESSGTSSEEGSEDKSSGQNKTLKN